MKKKITLVGGGNIGGTLAYVAALKELGNIVILDRDRDRAKGKALDIEQSLPIIKKEVKLIGTNDYKDIKDSDLVVITAGASRQKKTSREDLLSINAETIKIAAEGIKKYAPKSFVIIVTNPLDAMVYTFLKYSEFSRNKVVGMSGILDAARFSLLVARELNISPENVVSLVLGGHNDTMLPLIRYTNVNGIPLPYLIKKSLISKEKVAEIVEKTKSAGTEIIELFKSISAFYAPASAIIKIAESYLNDSNLLLPCSVLLNQEYGLSDICIGVPVIIGSNGIEKIITIDFNDEEYKIFNKSVESINQLILMTKKVL